MISLEPDTIPVWGIAYFHSEVFSETGARINVWTSVWESIIVAVSTGASTGIFNSSSVVLLSYPQWSE